MQTQENCQHAENDGQAGSASAPINLRRPLPSSWRSSFVRGRRCPGKLSRGFSLPEVLIVAVAGAVLTAIAIPMISSVLNHIKLNSMVGQVTAAVAKTRYRAIMDSQPYTLVIAVPANSYVIKNVKTGAVAFTVPLPQQVALNGGTSATYTFTFCPNGTVWGAGGLCPGTTQTPLLRATIAGSESDITVSSVGNVTTTNH
jgi:prepilin-type N-terminal cleavage/methylation domain-containing protein